MTIAFDSKPFQHNNVFQIVLCAKFRGKKLSLNHFMRESAKNALKISKTQLNM